MCRQYEVNELYNFETWGRQLSAFVEDVVKEPAFLICNSVGGNTTQYAAALPACHSECLVGFCITSVISWVVGTQTL